MPKPFLPVPDWFSWDNHGVGIAVASRPGDVADLVVLMVDNAEGQNRGLYRIGRAVDAAGQVTGGWTDWFEVPGWFSWENQGAGIVVADLDDNGQPDMLVLMVDNPDGANQGLFRIGRSLNGDGNVTGGWTDWMPVPGWESWENQGVAVALAPVGGGLHDLVVFRIDAPVGINQGWYRIGRGLDANGNITGGWTDWIVVPDWFSWENQGAGIAVVDLDRNGGRDLVLFLIDNAVGKNEGFYRIGRALGADGKPVGGWGPWLGVPHWFSWENQGGGLAAATLGGQRKLVFFMVDNPPGQNAGFYQLLTLDHDPSVQGSWEKLPFLSGVLAVHSALLPNGKVLFFAGSGSSAVRFNSPLFGDEAQGIFTSVVWDPPGNSFSHPPTLRAADGKPFDFFCGGDAFLADGRMLSAGGTLAYNNFKGRKDAAVFDWRTEQWSFTAAMAHGRWYPTLITLGDGSVLATTGLNEAGTEHNQALESYAPASNTWQARHFFPGFPGLPLYAHLFLMADGRIFFSGGRMDDPMVVDPFVFDPTHDPVPTQPVKDLLDPVLRNQSASVLLPPAQDQRVMICGGGPEGKANRTHATEAVSIVDLKAVNPDYVAAAPLALARIHLNAVLLPDRTVFVSGGALKQEDELLARLQAEIYDPATDSWEIMAAAEVARMYHSTALLLPDGRVVAAGGNPEGGHQVNWVPPDKDEELQLEIFSPPYLFRGPRPVIDSAPQAWAYDRPVEIGTPQAGVIRWASLIKNGVTTHSFDSGQRLIDLPIAKRGASSITVTVTDNPNIAPPGWYMLFLVDEDGVPSLASWIELG